MAESLDIRAIVFDLDGVVVFPWGFANYLEREHGIMRAQTAEFFAGPFNQCIKGKADVKAILPPYLETWRWPGTLDEFVEKWLVTENLPDERLLAEIARLRKAGLRCALGTNQEYNRAEYIRKDMGFEKYFDELFFSCEIGYMKPELEYFYHAAKVLDFAPGEILFIDNEDKYVNAARQAGWQARLYTTYEELIDSGELSRLLG